LYTPDGQLNETEISISELPKVLIEPLNKKHPNVKIDEAEKLNIIPSCL